MRLAAALVICAGMLGAQPRYDLLIRGGHVLDPGNGINGVMDVALAGGKIARVATGIAPGEAKKVIEAKGLYVTPGLIDLHAHVFGYMGSIRPDDSALPAGTTTVVDAGGSGWRTFEEMLERVIQPAKTRVLALINIVGHGMIGQSFEDNVEDMDPAKTAAKIAERRPYIVGIKTAHFGGYGWAAVDAAVAAGKLSNTPVMVDDKILTLTGRTSKEKLLERMRPGDMHTHVFNDRQLEMLNRANGKLQPWVMAARERGVKFDLGHGAGSFLWPVAAKALEQGFYPDTISTDLHSSSIMLPESDMPNCISKLMSLGMPLEEAMVRSTVNPAKAIGLYPEIGTLGEGRVADVAVFTLREGLFAFKDAWHNKQMGSKRLEAVLTVRAGELVYDRDGRGFPEWTKAGAYEVIP